MQLDRLRQLLDDVKHRLLELAVSDPTATTTTAPRESKLLRDPLAPFSLFSHDEDWDKVCELTRRLTQRLEGLQRGVKQWGEGDLSARVDESGRDEVAYLAYAAPPPPPAAVAASNVAAAAVDVSW